MTTRRGLHGECAVRDTFVLCDGQVRYRRTAHGPAESFIANQIQENWMKLVKISAIAFAMSAMLAGPVLAQGASSDTKMRGGTQDRSNMQGGMQGGASGSGDEEFNEQPGAPGQKAGVHAKTGAKGTVGASRGAPKGAAGMAEDPAAGGKRQ
jgi:hypothetical protein